MSRVRILSIHMMELIAKNQSTYGTSYVGEIAIWKEILERMIAHFWQQHQPINFIHS